MADGGSIGSRDVYYYLHNNLSPIKIKEPFLGQDNTYMVNLSDISELFIPPPHMTFMGWYSKELNEIFKTIWTSNSLPDSLELYAKWDINTSFKFKGVPLFDFSKGGTNVTSQDLIEGTIAYDAKGFPITGIITNAAEVSF